MAIELSKSAWKLAFHDGSERRPRVVSVQAGDLAGLSETITKAKGAFGLSPECRVRSCYEAGREGFSVHRLLTQPMVGIDNVVVDAGSIEVVRRRHAKTDRLDALMLVDKLHAHTQQRKAFSVVRVPSVDDEAARQLDRERETLKKERGQHVTRVRNLLFAEGIRVDEDIKPERLKQRLPKMRSLDGRELSTPLRRRLERELARIDLVDTQLKTLDEERKATLVTADDDRAKRVRQMTALKGVGEISSVSLVVETFGWRKFDNRHQVGAVFGLAPTPFASGQMQREQGISKTGNRRMRALLIELAWLWVRWQPDSKITRWFLARFANNGSRARRVGIVAVARKLAIALWQYLEGGVVPEGAILKAA